jgi:acyl-CoA reductase-like NAD-dependent aldehyde dehydrogenase
MDLSKIRMIKQLFINGKFVNGIKNKTFDVINPSDETVLATIAQATKEDVDLAVSSARHAF